MAPNTTPNDQGLRPAPAPPKPKKMNAVSRFSKTFSLSRKLKKKREGELLDTLEGHEGGINCLAMSIDESILVTGSEDCTARVWAITEQNLDDRLLGVLEGHTSYITCIAMFDRFVFTGSADGDIRKWDITTCECVYVYKGHMSKIHKLLVTEHFIFSTSHDKTARLWYTDVLDRKPCIRTFKGHGHAVYPLIYIPYLEDDDEEEEDIRGKDKNNKKTEDLEDEEIHPRDLLATGSADTSIKIWSVFSGECLETLRNHTGSVVALATDPHGKILYSCGADSFIRYWDLKTRKQIKSIDAHRSAIVSMHINHRLMYTGSQDGMAKCWVTEFGDNTVVYKGHTMSVTVIKFYKGLVITGCGDGVIRCFDAKSGHLLRTFSGHEGAIIALHMARDQIFSTTTDGVVRVFHIDWKFIKVYLAVLSGEVESVLDDAQEILDEKPNLLSPGSAVSSRRSSASSGSGSSSRRSSNASSNDGLEDIEEENSDTDDGSSDGSGDESSDNSGSDNDDSKSEASSKSGADSGSGSDSDSDDE